MMDVLILDAYNLYHRARSGFKAGEHPITYNFLRGLRPIFDKFKPGHAYLVLEGTPVHRLSGHVEYKGTRKKMPEDDRQAFYRQVAEIEEIVGLYMPIIIMKHENHEADDVIAQCARDHANAGDNVIIVSSDSDFIQLIKGSECSECLSSSDDEESQQQGQIHVYDPKKKEFMLPVKQYLKWKALRGDSSDNIKGIPGVGDKTASKYILFPQLFEQNILNVPEKNEIFERNFNLIKFEKISAKEMNASILKPLIKPSERLWDSMRKKLEEMKFQSMTNDTSWKKYTKAFSTIQTTDI